MYQYLGIKIGKTSESLYTLNCPPIFKKITEELKRWTNLPISFLGRCHLLKMMSFSKLLYPLQTLPLLIKHQDNATMNKAFKSFIWCNKKPRISLATLQRHKMEGGVGFPDIRLYNLASLMRHALDWLQGTSKFSVLKIEQELAKPWNLNALLHTKYSKLPSILKHSILLRDTIG